jgi:hypothetical protein
MAGWNRREIVPRRSTLAAKFLLVHDSFAGLTHRQMDVFWPHNNQRNNSPCAEMISVDRDPVVLTELWRRLSIESFCFPVWAIYAIMLAIRQGKWRHHQNGYAGCEAPKGLVRWNWPGVAAYRAKRFGL